LTRRAVRITGGRQRNRTVRVPAGVRPTSSRVRQALFSIWLERLPGADLLDLFAGAGVVALEALSRGAEKAVCVDRSAVSLGVIAANAVALGQPRLQTVRMELPEDLAHPDRRLDGRFDLIFIDPPYRFEDYGGLLELVAPKLRIDGEVAVEHSTRREMPMVAGPLARVRSSSYGESSLSLYARQPGVE